MGDSYTIKVSGKGKISVQLPSRKILSLSNVLHVPAMRRNLISSFSCNKPGMKCMLGDDKVVFTHNGQYMGNGFCNGVSLYSMQHVK